jgi:hypothetical protein
MKRLNLILFFQISVISIFSLSCTNKMDQMYLLEASTSAYPTGTPIDTNGDGKVDGLDVNNDGLIDMRFVSPIGIPATGIDINNDGISDFFMYTTNAGSSFNTKADGTGTSVSIIIKNGQLIGYDTTGDGVVDINVTGSNVTYYAVGGTATGVTSNIILSLTINNSSYEYLTVSANGTYKFTSNLNGGYFYSVAIASSSQQCTIANGSGIIAGSDITNIVLTCGNLTVGGSITPALTGTMMLSLTINNTSTEFLTLPATSSSFTFASKSITGAFYSVLIVSSTDTCKIAFNTGTVAAVNVTTVVITCSQYTVGGTITPALTAPMMLSLSVNNTVVENLNVVATSINFIFLTKLFNSEVYEVQIVSTTQNCTISSNIGTIAGANAPPVAVSCGQYLAGVNITAPSRPDMILSLTVNGVLKGNLTLTALAGALVAAPFNFTTNLLTGDVYSIQIVSSSLNCKISGNTGTVTVLPVNAPILCAQYTVGNSAGTPVVGLTAGNSVGLSLSVNGIVKETITVTNPATLFTFTSSLFTNDSYNILIISSTKSCKITSNSGIIAAANITNVAVTCAQYTVGNSVGTPIVGLTGGNSVSLSLTVNGTYVETVTVSNPTTTFAFLANLFGGDAYNVQIISATQSCKIASNSGLIAAASITNVAVTCAQFTVGNSVGTPIVGLTGGNSVSLSLSVNGTYAETITVSNPTTTFTFTMKLFGGDAYNVQIVSSTQSCKVSSNTGIIAAVNVTNIAVNCAQFTVGGTINPNPTYTAALTSNMIISLSVNGIVVENIFKPSGTVANTAYAFTTNLYSLDIYNVQIGSTTQTCTITNNSGTISASVSNVTVQCAQFTVQGNVVYTAAFGTSGSITLELTVISGINIYTETLLPLSIPAANSTTAYGPFLRKLLSGDQYTVQVITENLTGPCTPAVGATGTIAAANITAPTANINCP